MQEEEYLSLLPEEKKVLEGTRNEIEQKVEEALREGKKLEQEIISKLQALDQQAGEYLARIPFLELKKKLSSRSLSSNPDPTPNDLFAA